MRAVFLVLITLALGMSPALAKTRCLIVADATSGTIVHSEGAQCDEGIGPASTFKLTLALAGFDAGVLDDPERPAWPYKASYNGSREAERATTTPRRWLSESVLWYSREVVARLGAARFADYMRALDYGNADVRGEPGANNGMTHAWLNTSLVISPKQQATFLFRMLGGTLPVSVAAVRNTVEALPRFPAGGWMLVGKTGTGYVREASGKLGNRQYGWFVGWGERDGQRLVFAYLIEDERSGRSAAGPRARDDLLGRWSSVTGR